MIRLILILNLVILSNSNPCDVTNKKSDRIQFRQDDQAGKKLFLLPFVGNKIQIKEITMKSNEISSKMVNDYFRLDFKTLILNKDYDLDNIKIDFIELLFTCTSSLTSFTNTFLLYITISDINNYAPEFIDLPYKFEVKELTQIGTIVYKKIHAIDRDLPHRPNSQISFSILPSLYSDYFEFPLSTNSQLAVAKTIHYNVFKKCNLMIKAEDHGSPPKSTTTMVEIDIIDTDDKEPIFTKTVYNGFISHNSPLGTFVNMSAEQIAAYDQDTGINMTLRYLLDSNPGNLFDINAEDGRIFLKNEIPKGFKNGFSLIVKAHQIDNAEKSNLATVNINVININEHVPVFDKNYYEASIKEDSYFNTPIITVQAIDNDDNLIEYFMVKNHENSFVIDAKSGLIKLNRRLDYETQSIYTIEIGARDDKHTSTVTVKIIILNVIDCAPDFEQAYYNFKVKSPNDVYIGQVRAIDVENTGHLSYSLEFPNNGESKLFCITKSGVIYICPQSTKTELFTIGDNSETISGNIFSKNEYVFYVQASIPFNSTTNLTTKKVECRIQIEYKVLAEAPSLSISDREIIFKDPNTFYAFLAAVGGIAIVMVTSIIIMVWYKCQGRKSGQPNFYKSSANTMSSESSSRSFHSSLNNTYLNGTKSLKKASTALDKTIINQWEEKGINGIFYGTEVAKKENSDLAATEIQKENEKRPDNSDKGSKKSISIYSVNRRKSNKSLSRSLSSASSTSIPITTVSSSSRTQTPSFSSLGVLASLAVDNTINEELYSYPQEPLTINYETSVNNAATAAGEQDDIQTTSFYKCELVVPQNCKYDEIKLAVDDASFNVDDSATTTATLELGTNNNNKNKYHQINSHTNLADNCINCDTISDSYQYSHYHELYSVRASGINNIYGDYHRIAYV